MTDRIIRQINDLTLDQINDRLRNIELNRQVQADLNRFGMFYKGPYDPDTCYKAGDVVLVNNNYLARARRDTCESAQITPKGEPFWFSGLGDVPPPFDGAGGQYTAKLRGNQYNMPTYGQSVYISKLRFLSPSVVTNHRFRPLHAIWREANQDWVYDEIIGEFSAATPNTWVEIQYSALWLVTEYHQLWTYMRRTTTPVTGAANWQQENKNEAPDENKMTFYSNQTRMRFNHIDENDNNLKDSLETVPPGATITRGSDSWTVITATYNANDTDFTVSPSGQRNEEDVYSFGFSYDAAGDTWHANLNRAGQWPFDSQIVRGMWANYPNNPDYSYVEEQYMLDPYIQQVTISEDWDILTVPNT